MSARNYIASSVVLILPALAIAWAPTGYSTELSETETVVLVAKPQMYDPLYGETILLAKPMGDGMHVGFILNRPTKVTLADTFPGHGPSKKIREPLYLGGPVEVNAVFALVASHASPGRGATQLSPDLFLVMTGDTVDRVIETDAEHARFFAGAVVWRPGELDEELKRGAWYVIDPDPEVVLPRKTEGHWQRLVHRAEMRENGI